MIVVSYGGGTNSTALLVGLRERGIRPDMIKDVRKPPSAVPVILAEDGTWHRPLTTLELAVLQGFPVLIDGEPLELDGSSSIAWRERIGNAVPPPAAQAIAERMLVALVQADAEAFALDGGGEVWVEPERIGGVQ